MSMKQNSYVICENKSPAQSARDCLQSNLSIHIPKGCCQGDYHLPMKSNQAFVQNLGNGIYRRAILVAVTSECRVKRVIWKTWTRTLANSADPDQTPQNAASDPGLHCLFKSQEVQG